MAIELVARNRPWRQTKKRIIMPPRTNVFYAYPSDPPAIGETISEALAGFRRPSKNNGPDVRVRLWTDVRISGRNLASEIIEQIDRADVFACDLTYPNKNVSFELGYAIGRYKRLFVSMDSGIEQAPINFRRHYFDLTGLGYSPYENHQDLRDALNRESPWDSSDRTLLHSRYRQTWARPESPTLLYLKPAIDTDSVIAALDILYASEFNSGLWVDDPKENPSQSLDWYAERLAESDAAVIHLLGNQHSGHFDHNIKASMIAGLARGLNRPILMLAHGPYDTPIDYQDLLKQHDTADSCKHSLSIWLKELSEDLPRRRSRRSLAPTRHTLELRHMSLGETVAEQEPRSLDDYFVETDPYFKALESHATILVGRRGSGKSAIMFGIFARVQRDRQYHPTVISPVGYEVDGLVRILTEIEQRSERGFLIESLWKFLIYSEIALSIERALSERPVYLSREANEEAFLAYCVSYGNVLNLPFSERLDNVVRSLEGVGTIGDAMQQRARVSEALHQGLLRELRRHIGLVLGTSKKLMVLVDNLDRPWNPGANVNSLAELIGGLLNVVQDLPRDLSLSNRGLNPVEAQITVLLRSDIFAFVRPWLSEPDKLPVERVFWEGQDSLLRVLDERLLNNAPRTTTADDIWLQIFPTEVDGYSPREFILRYTLARPRDVIYLVREAMSNAKNRDHESVSPEDLLDARARYSEYVLRAVLAEDDPSSGKLEAILYEFAGANTIVTIKEIQDCILTAGVDEGDVNQYTDLLCDIGFLGVASGDGFRYPHDEIERHTLRQISRRIANRLKIDEKFEIGPAFYSVLQIA